MSIEKVMASVEKIEANLDAFAKKAEAEAKAAGSVSAETKSAIDKISQAQLEFAQRLAAMEQKSTRAPEQDAKPESVGEQFVKSPLFEQFNKRERTAIRVETKNTSVGSDTTVAPDRRPGIVGGAFRRLRIEDVLNQSPTGSNAVEYTRENTFVNNAAETAEAAAKPESDVTFTLVTAPVRTIAHWTRISRQLAADNGALMAYINTRMQYGVQLRVENQLIVGNGTGQNISGLYNTGNFTPHGYTAASLGAGFTRIDVIGRVLGDLENTDYPANGVILNPADWWSLKLTKDTQGRYIFGDPANDNAPMIWGVPVVASAAMTADNFLAGAFDMCATQYNREGVAIAMSEEDASNFTTNLITIRAERRVALGIERAASLRGGDLTPA
jgi:HK97 family phage major capsid protein